MSEESEDPREILQSLFQSRNDWKSVPQIVYLTFKAFFRSISQIQQKNEEQSAVIYNTFEEQKLFIHEQSIKLREIDLKLMSKINKKQLDRSLQKMRKSRTLKYENEESFGSYLGQKSQGLDKTMIEEVKTITQAVMDKKVLEIEKIIKDELEEITEKNNSNSKVYEQISRQIIKRQEYIDSLEGKMVHKINSTEICLREKINLDTKTVLSFIEDNFLTSQLLEKKIQQSQFKMKQSRRKQIEKIKVDLEQKILELQKSIRTKGRNLVKQKASDNHEFIEFKHKITKQLTNFIKIEQVQGIFAKFQNDILSKYQKQDKKLLQFQDRVMCLFKQTHMEFKKQQKKEQKMKKQGNSHKKNSLKQIRNSLENLQNYFELKLSEIRQEFAYKLENDISKSTKKVKESFEQKAKYCCDILEENCNRISKQYDPNVKSILVKLESEMIKARYLYFGQRQCKDLILWDKQAVNMMGQNFICKPGQSTITVVAAGLYKIQAGLYKDVKIDEMICYIVLNGEPICQFGEKQKRKNSQTQARGCIFSEPVLLPANSKISVRVEKAFYGQAFCQIEKL